MSSRPISLFVNFVALVLGVLVLLVILHPIHTETVGTDPASSTQMVASASSPAASSPLVVATTSMSTTATTTKKSPSVKAPTSIAVKVGQQTTASVQAPVFEIARTQHPYSTPPLSFDEVNVSTRGALVNILCMPQGGGSLQPISGSGVIIDPRGVILTNAHVAQYVLLSESPRVDLSCVIRTGSPATPKWAAEVLFIPPVWVGAHVSDINTDHPMGTGEHDYALLRITRSLNASPLPATFPALTYDTREVVGFLNDPVLGAAYPAEFIGGFNTQNNLNAVSSVSTISQLLTFSSQTVDMVSIGGVIEAQAGSSGGAVVNAWDKLIGLITTTSEGKTTADRSLHALTLSYINRDLKAQIDTDLASYLQGDLAAREEDFNKTWTQHLIDLYIAQISK